MQDLLKSEEKFSIDWRWRESGTRARRRSGRWTGKLRTRGSASSTRAQGRKSLTSGRSSRSRFWLAKKRLQNLQYLHPFAPLQAQHLATLDGSLSASSTPLTARAGAFFSVFGGLKSAPLKDLRRLAAREAVRPGLDEPMFVLTFVLTFC